jgi:hypothetical protein
MSARFLLALSFVGSLCVAGCGGGGGGGGSTPPVSPTITSVSVSCTPTSVQTGQTSQCSAAVTGTGSYSSTVNWAVDAVQGGSATVGSINSAGLYSAPSAVPTPYTVSVTATSIQDASKSASAQMVIAGVIASTSQAIAASTGGTVSLTDGSSVTIAPGTLSADTTITLSKVSVPSSQPNNPAIGSVGPALVLGFSSPAHFLFRSGSGERLATPDALPEGAFSSSLHFVINVAGNISASLTNSVPMAGLISSTNGVAASFVGGIGPFDATAQTVTGDISGYALQAASVVTGPAVAIELTAQNFIQAKLQTYLPQNSWALNVVPSNPPADTWQSYSGCPTGKTLLVVHGMDSSVTETYKTTDSTIQNIKESGGYDSVVGYDYDWTNAIDTSGAYVAAFLNTLAQCSGVASIDIEAHSEGVAVTLSALTDVSASTRQKIPHVIAVAGPIMGTPMANTADLAGYLASQPGAVVAFGLASQGLAYVLSQPFVADLVVSVPGDNSKLDIIRRTVSPYSSANAPQIFVVAGDDPGSMQVFADMMALNGVNFSDGFIPLSSALAFQNNSSNLPVLKVYPLPPFPGNHIQLIGNSSLVGPSVAHAVGAQINTSATSPTLSLSSIPSCTNSIVCSGTAGTYFSLGGSGLTNADNYALYQQDDTGNVTSPPLAANFIASNATVPPNTWQDTPPCGVAPHTLVLFAQDTNSNSLLASNAVTEQVIAGTCIAPNPAPSITSVAVSCTPQAILTGQTSNCTASVSGTGSFSTSVNWSVSPTGIGVISSAGVLTPAAVGTALITATSTQDSTKSGLATVAVTASASGQTAGEWAWVSGANTVFAPGVYGTQGLPAAANVPGARFGSVSWIDSSGNLWLFGGDGYDSTGTWGDLNDLWEFNPTNKEWTWMSGSNTINAVGVYGTLGVPSAANVPGARQQAVSWADSSGNLWLFGGAGDYDSTSGTASDLNDLWEFNPVAKTWTWMSGANTVFAPGVYGTQGAPATANVPGARDSAVSWIDSSGNLWLFGGSNLNDLWEFNPAAKTWVWVSGANTTGATGNYGTQGVASPSNVPGARESAVSWIDSSGNLWLFGGSNLNDLWEFNPAAKTWVWVSGANTTGATGNYGTQGVASTTNVPGARWGSVSWVDSSGNLWLFGGVYPASNGYGNFLNDLWEFNPKNKEWTWVSGANTVFAPGVYGTQGVASPSNVPGARESAVSWIDSSGNLWLFGGDGYDSTGTWGYLNDLWRYQP